MMGTRRPPPPPPWLDIPMKLKPPTLKFRAKPQITAAPGWLVPPGPIAGPTPLASPAQSSILEVLKGLGPRD